MKTESPAAYGEAPLGVECALPGKAPRLAHPGATRAGFWRRMIYRIRYGIKLSASGQLRRIG